VCASLELMTSAAASTRSRCEVVSCCSTRYIVCILNIAYQLPRQRKTLQSVGNQALEQEIKVLKKHGGIVGLSQDERALDRLVTITPQLAHMVEQYLHGFPSHGTSPESECHYQLVGDVAVRIHANAKKIAQSIDLQCEGNPYKIETPLKNLSSSAVIAKDMKDDILEFPSRGRRRLKTLLKTD